MIPYTVLPGLALRFVLSPWARDFKDGREILITLSPMWRIIFIQEKFAKNEFRLVLLRLRTYRIYHFIMQTTMAPFYSRFPTSLNAI